MTVSVKITEKTTVHNLNPDQTYDGIMPTIPGYVLSVLSGQIVGFEERGPYMFRVYWNEAAQAGVFNHCKNCDDYLQAYALWRITDRLQARRERDQKQERVQSAHSSQEG